MASEGDGQVRREEAKPQEIENGNARRHFQRVPVIASAMTGVGRTGLEPVTDGL